MEAVNSLINMQVPWRLYTSLPLPFHWCHMTTYGRKLHSPVKWPCVWLKFFFFFCKILGFNKLWWGTFQLGEFLKN